MKHYHISLWVWKEVYCHSHPLTPSPAATSDWMNLQAKTRVAAMRERENMVPQYIELGVDRIPFEAPLSLKVKYGWYLWVLKNFAITHIAITNIQITCPGHVCPPQNVILEHRVMILGTYIRFPGGLWSVVIFFYTFTPIIFTALLQSWKPVELSKNTFMKQTELEKQCCTISTRTCNLLYKKTLTYSCSNFPQCC